MYIPNTTVKVKGTVLPYSLASAGLGADPCVQAVSPQVTWSHPPGGRLPVLSARPAVTFPVEERHHPSAGTKLYCLVTEARGVSSLPKAVTWKLTGRGSNPWTNAMPHRPPVTDYILDNQGTVCWTQTVAVHCFLVLKSGTCFNGKHRFAFFILLLQVFWGKDYFIIKCYLGHVMWPF